jgi:hypothetical protein
VQVKTAKGYDGGLAVGQRQKFTYQGSGPASYSQTTGDVITTPFGVYLDDIYPCMDTTHTYFLIPYPSAINTTRATWTFKWFTAAGMTEVGNGVNLSAFQVQFGAFGGEF